VGFPVQDLGTTDLLFTPQRTTSHRPEAAIILLSGSSIDGGEETGVQEGAEEVLPKPFANEDLLGLDRKVLDQSKDPDR